MTAKSPKAVRPSTRALAFEILREKIDLGGVFAAGRRLDVLDRTATLFDQLQKIAFGAALEDFADKRSTWREHFFREGPSDLRQTDDP